MELIREEFAELWRCANNEQYFIDKYCPNEFGKLVHAFVFGRDVRIGMFSDSAKQMTVDMVEFHNCIDALPLTMRQLCGFVQCSKTRHTISVPYGNRAHAINMNNPCSVRGMSFSHIMFTTPEWIPLDFLEAAWPSIMRNNVVVIDPYERLPMKPKGDSQ